MVLKSITTKIQPTNQTEKCFYEAISKTKAVELDPRSLIFSFLGENVLYSEAMALAESAIEWAEDLERNYDKFKSRAKFITKSEESCFLSYCAKNNWSTKKNSKDVVARDGSKFKAIFELETKRVYMILDLSESLKLMQVLNELGGHDVLH